MEDVIWKMENVICNTEDGKRLLVTGECLPVVAGK